MSTSKQKYAHPSGGATFVIEKRITSGRTAPVEIVLSHQTAQVVIDIATLNNLRSDLRSWFSAYLSAPWSNRTESSKAHWEMLDEFVADLIRACLPGHAAPAQIRVFGQMADVILDREALEMLHIDLRFWFKAYQPVWESGITKSNLEQSTEYYGLLSTLLAELIEFNLSRC